MAQISKTKWVCGGRNFKPLSLPKEEVGAYAELRNIGIALDHADKMTYAMDDTSPSVVAGRITNPIQYLQNWLPGFVSVMTRATKIDEIVGLNVAGDFADEEVIQPTIEHLGLAVPYGDSNDVTFADFLSDYERRSVVRFEIGFSVGTLEESRATRAGINPADAKRSACAKALEIRRNAVGFYGYNAGVNRTYGLLNDPSLSAYVTVPNGAGGSPLWTLKTYGEIIGDITSAMSALRVQSGDLIDVNSTPITMALGTSRYESLATVNPLGSQSVMTWLATAYPNVRVVSAPELDGANAGANVFYLFAESVADSGTDDGRVIAQIVPSKFQTVGVSRGIKTYQEAFANATAGVFVKRPYAVVRRTGI